MTLDNNLHKLLSHLDSINDTLPMVMLQLSPHQKKVNEEFEKFFKENVEEIEEEDGEKSISVPYEKSKVFDQLSKNALISNLANKVLPESLFVSLISQYDSFTNNLLKILFELRPEYINNSERELTFSQLVEFKSIEEAREYIIEKEVETVLRKSHSEQFDYLEKKLGIPLRKNLPVWQTFVEITQRRNLFVHCDGIVSNQYLKVCKESKCDSSKIKVGQRLNINTKYFNQAYECIYELASKLTHTIWRKLLKEDIKKADQKLNSICFDLLNNNQLRLANVLLEFAVKQNKHFNNSSKNMFIINKALSLYLDSKGEEAKKIMQGKDWSASSDDFKLANFVITEEYDNVYALMRKIGNDGEVDRENYRSWPLFFKLRGIDKFKQTYKDIFDEEYKSMEIPKRPLQKLITEMIEKDPELKSKTVQKELSKKQKLEKEESK
jgi:hypothetical protein